MGSQMSVNDPTGGHQVQKTWRRNVARAFVSLQAGLQSRFPNNLRIGFLEPCYGELHQFAVSRPEGRLRPRLAALQKQDCSFTFTKKSTRHRSV